ncbi:hypothetical protein TVAG_233260 [Trichomonas vaginalis G3]|uniref:Uncharacterized protein n=1 Tax=Trichomonas vaginalis (strain ATCC PRA-98 / G3) TaxID=412133 RepID=A2ERZ5_TRIV3|nr:hypothetical protein TVAGG3_0486820 [Trichomonas vaginalis G3]EAY04590.1 hypothetical protein TVAG_233260 [Trichomonas vaginalis G3]KAI5516091.1 hypothetical protein TVAGG3_0486820 [Trichomonas vaginalis G3]|eukprot:XP_001316813.1 hypothetical protein [Trichomonas vaginalis G3]
MSDQNTEQSQPFADIFAAIAMMLKDRYPIFCSVFAPQENFKKNDLNLQDDFPDYELKDQDYNYSTETTSNLAEYEKYDFDII